MKRFTAMIAAVAALGMATPSWSQEGETLSYSFMQSLLMDESLDLYWTGLHNGILAGNAGAATIRGLALFCPPDTVPINMPLVKLALRNEVEAQRNAGITEFYPNSIGMLTVIGLEKMFPCE